MKKKIALFISLITLGFLFCFGLTQVCAEETQPTTTTETTTTDTTTTTEEDTTTDDAVNSVLNLVDYLKTFNADDLKGWVVAVISYLSANLLVIVAMAIKLMMNFTSKVKNDEKTQALLENVDEKYAKIFNDFMDGVMAKLNASNEAITQFAKTEDGKKRAELIASAQVSQQASIDLINDLQSKIEEEKAKA